MLSLLGSFVGKGAEQGVLTLERGEVLAVQPDRIDATLAQSLARAYFGQHQIDGVFGAGNPDRIQLNTKFGQIGGDDLIHPDVDGIAAAPVIEIDAALFFGAGLHVLPG